MALRVELYLRNHVPKPLSQTSDIALFQKQVRDLMDVDYRHSAAKTATPNKVLASLARVGLAIGFAFDWQFRYGFGER